MQTAWREVGDEENNVRMHHRRVSCTSANDGKFSFMMPECLPAFSLDDATVTVLESPKEFHQTLIRLYKSAKRRICLAALYIGTSTPEQQVLRAVQEACQKAADVLSGSAGGWSDDESPVFLLPKPHCQRHDSDASLCSRSASTRSSESSGQVSSFRVDVLIDAIRGRRQEVTRDGKTRSSLTMLQDLLHLKHTVEGRLYKKDDDGDLYVEANGRLVAPRSQGDGIPAYAGTSDPCPVNINVGLFHSPLLSGLLYKLLPTRINEVLGVFHTKIFLADTSVILTGANLSGSYLTDRQDRYVLIEHAPHLTDFLQRFVIHMQQFSYDASLLALPAVPTERLLGDQSMSRHQETVTTEDSATKATEPNAQRPLSCLPVAHARTQYVPVEDSSSKLRWLVKLELPSTCACPIQRPEDYREQLSTSLSEFLAYHARVHASHSLRSAETTLHVAVQAGFVSPPLCHEEVLLTHILHPRHTNTVTAESTRGQHDCGCHLVSPNASSLWRSALNPFVPSFFFTSFESCRRKNYGVRSLLAHLPVTPTTPPLVSFNRTREPTCSSATLDATTPQQQHIPSCNLKSAQLSSSLPVSPPLFPFVHRQGVRSLSSPSPRHLHRIVVASGYLNMAPELLEKLTDALCCHPSTRSPPPLSSASLDKYESSQLEVFVAAPEANSFFESRGISKYIPMAYSYVGASQLLELKRLWMERQKEGLSLSNDDGSPSTPPQFWEYDRPGWTFHSKGLWLYDENVTLPFATVVGSSNLGLRAKHRDLDVSFFIQTRDPQLKQQFGKEVEALRPYVKKVSDVTALIERCPRWLRCLLRWAGLKSLL